MKRLVFAMSNEAFVKANISSSEDVITAFFSWDIRVKLELVSILELPLSMTKNRNIFIA